MKNRTIVLFGLVRVRVAERNRYLFSLYNRRSTKRPCSDVTPAVCVCVCALCRASSVCRAAAGGGTSSAMTVQCCGPLSKYAEVQKTFKIIITSATHRKKK